MPRIYPRLDPMLRKHGVPKPPVNPLVNLFATTVIVLFYAAIIVALVKAIAFLLSIHP